jgi:hypothetical protein
MINKKTHGRAYDASSDLTLRYFHEQVYFLVNHVYDAQFLTVIFLELYCFFFFLETECRLH